MSPRKPNQKARALAVLALAVVTVLSAFIIVTSGGGSSDTPSDVPTEVTQTPEIRKALQRGVYVVRPGDTLVAISEGTGIEINDLLALNPDLDPQTLLSGQRIRLR